MVTPHFKRDLKEVPPGQYVLSNLIGFLLPHHPSPFALSQFFGGVSTWLQVTIGIFWKEDGCDGDIAGVRLNNKGLFWVRVPEDWLLGEQAF